MEPVSQSPSQGDNWDFSGNGHYWDEAAAGVGVVSGCILLAGTAPVWVAAAAATGALWSIKTLADSNTQPVPDSFSAPQITSDDRQS
jgi:hypothetical protein